MAGTIIPMVHGASIRKKGLVLGLHALGSVLGGCLCGYAIALAGAGIRGWAGLTPRGSVCVGVVGLIGLAYGAGGLGVARVVIPQLRRQVPRRWRHVFSPAVAAALYGLELGFGLTTRIRAGAYVCVAAWILLVPELWTGALIMGLGYGLGRALPLFLIRAGCGPARVVGEANAIRLLRWDSVARLIDGLVISFVGGSLLRTGLRSLGAPL